MRFRELRISKDSLPWSTSIALGWRVSHSSKFGTISSGGILGGGGGAPRGGSYPGSGCQGKQRWFTNTYHLHNQIQSPIWLDDNVRGYELVNVIR